MKRVYFLFLSASLAGCNFDAEKAGANSELQARAAAANYPWLREKVLGPKCLACHSGPSAHGDLTSLETMLQGRLVVPGSPERSPLYVEVETGRMPKGGNPLGPHELRALFDWISEGAKPGASRATRGEGDE